MRSFLEFLNEQKKIAQSSKLTGQFLYEEKSDKEKTKNTNTVEIEKSFKFDSGDGNIEMHSKKDGDGKMHYYKKENGKTVEIDKKEFDKGQDYREKDLERARQLKQKAEDAQRELDKKAREEALKGKDKSEKREPSEAKKAWDGALDKMAGSGNIFGQIIGHTGKILTGLVSGIVGFAAGKLKNDIDTDVLSAQIANLDMMFKDNADKLAELSDDEKEVLEDTKEDLNKAMRAVVDEKGKPVPLSEREKILKGNMSDDEWEEWKQKHADSFNKMKDTEGFDSFGDLSKLSDEELERIQEHQKKLNADAHNSQMNDLVNEKHKNDLEESKRHREKLGELEAEYDEQKRGLQNYERDVKRAQKDLDNIKREDFDSDAAYEAEKHKLQRQHEDLQKTYNDLSDELKKDYDDKVKEENETHKKNFKKNEEDYQKKAEEIGKETIELISKKANNPKNSEDTKSNEDDTEQEEDDPQDSDERTDNDDDLENEKFGTKNGKITIDDKGKDPRKIYKQRTYKRGNKTFKTKSYYSKKGIPISKEEFKQRLDAYEKKQKNEGLGSYLKVRLLNENLNIDKYLNRELK